MAEKEFNDVRINVEFKTAEKRELLVSGEDITTSFGKINRAISDINEIESKTTSEGASSVIARQPISLFSEFYSAITDSRSSIPSGTSDLLYGGNGSAPGFEICKSTLGDLGGYMNVSVSNTAGKDTASGWVITCRKANYGSANSTKTTTLYSAPISVLKRCSLAGYKTLFVRTTVLPFGSTLTAIGGGSVTITLNSIPNANSDYVLATLADGATSLSGSKVSGFSTDLQMDIQNIVDDVYLCMTFSNKMGGATLSSNGGSATINGSAVNTSYAVSFLSAFMTGFVVI